jgi:hypothetical protein
MEDNMAYEHPQIINGIYIPPKDAPEAEDGGPVPDGPYDQDKFGFYGIAVPDGYIVADARAASWLLYRTYGLWEGPTVFVILPEGDDVAWVVYDCRDAHPTEEQEQAVIRVHRYLIRNDPRKRRWVTNPRRRTIDGRPVCPTRPKDDKLAKRLSWGPASFPIPAGLAAHLARAMMKILGAGRVVRGEAS